MKAFAIDVSRCNGCYCCQIGCKDEHCGNDWTPYAKPQPEWKHFWGKLNEYERGAETHVKVSYVFVPCQHCDDAPCIDACPVEAIYRRPDGLVIINPVECTGCQLCLSSSACPYGVIYYNEALNIAQKCTGCAHLVERGWPIDGPRCMDNCPTEAIRFGEESSLDLNGTETLHPEYGLTPRVHYKNLPKRFVAGTVYDPSSNEVVIDADCSVSGAAGTATVQTNNFGDFWIDGLGKGEFTLTITNGGKTKTITGDTTEGDVGLADIALS
jgi:tetrathionate reductase subunit B